MHWMGMCGMLWKHSKCWWSMLRSHGRYWSVIVMLVRRLGFVGDCRLCPVYLMWMGYVLWQVCREWDCVPRSRSGYEYGCGVESVKWWNDEIWGSEFWRFGRRGYDFDVPYFGGCHMLVFVVLERWRELDEGKRSNKILIHSNLQSSYWATNRSGRWYTFQAMYRPTEDAAARINCPHVLSTGLSGPPFHHCQYTSATPTPSHTHFINVHQHLSPSFHPFRSIHPSDTFPTTSTPSNSRMRDSNSRPHPYEGRALTNWAKPALVHLRPLLLHHTQIYFHPTVLSQHTY